MSVQDFIERRLKQFLGADTRIHASGRTDAGVHAHAQVFHFDADWRHGEEKMLAALRCGFPDSIRISSVKKVSEKFHARHGVKKKIYEYNIYLGYAPPHLTRYRWSLGKRLPDADKMNAAAQMLLGKHDFTSFSANRRGSGEGETFVKNMELLEVAKRGNEMKLTTCASGYLFRMVRLITGALVAAGLDELSPADIKRILDAKKRGAWFQAAPARGLFLKKVFY